MIRRAGPGPYFPGRDITFSPEGVVCTLPWAFCRDSPVPIFKGMDEAVKRPSWVVKTLR